MDGWSGLSSSRESIDGGCPRFVFCTWVLGLVLLRAAHAGLPEWQGEIETTRPTCHIDVHKGTDTNLRRVYHSFEAPTCNLNRRKKWPEQTESRVLSSCIARQQEVSSKPKGRYPVRSRGGIRS